MNTKTVAKQPAPSPSPTRPAPQQQTLPWHAAANFALAANRLLTLVGPPGSGKTTFAMHYAMQATGIPPFERQGNPHMTESGFWGHKQLTNASTTPKDGRLAAAIARGGVFVLNDAGVVPNAVLSSLLDAAENNVVHNPNTEEVLVVPASFRIILTTNRESLKCRQGKSTFHSLRSRSLVLFVDEPTTQMLVGILRADFPALSRGHVERAISNWERFNPLASKGDTDDEAFRLGVREARQDLSLIQVGADEGTAVRLSFVDKYCHDPETHEAMRLKQGLAAGGDA